MNAIGEWHYNNEHSITNQSIRLGAAHHLGIVACSPQRCQGIVHKCLDRTRLKRIATKEQN